MIKFSDAAHVGATKKTKEGYLVATSRVARTGVQDYLARELGDAAKHLPPNQVVKVYRHEDQVFSEKFRDGLSRIPVTVEHPPVMVDSTNWKDYSVGEIGDRVVRDGDWWVVDPMIKDSAAEQKANTTHRQWSLGYTAEIVPARDGIDADFEMVNMQPNHLSMVARGRAGDKARIGDADNWGASPVTVEDNKMTVELKTVILGDKAVQVEAKDADTVALILKDHKTAIDAKDAEIALKDAEIVALTAKVLDEEKIEALVEEKIGRKKKKEEVIAKVGDAAKEFTDAQIEHIHPMLHLIADNKARNIIGDKQTNVTDGVSAWDAIYGKGK